MVNRSKLYSLDEECINIMEQKPRNDRSKFVREAIKEFHIKKINEKPKKPQIKIEVLN